MTEEKSTTLQKCGIIKKKEKNKKGQTDRGNEKKKRKREKDRRTAGEIQESTTSLKSPSKKLIK